MVSRDPGERRRQSVGCRPGAQVEISVVQGRRGRQVMEADCASLKGRSEKGTEAVPLRNACLWRTSREEPERAARRGCRKERL